MEAEVAVHSNVLMISLTGFTAETKQWY